MAWSCTNNAVHLKELPSQTRLVTGTGARLVYNMLLMTQEIWLEKIEALTRPSASTGPAPTNRRALATAMESKANANFMMFDELKEQ